MKLGKKQQDALLELAAHPTKLNGIFFRSIDYRYMDIRNVLNGRGAELYGGRFAPIGTKATYLSDSDRTASAEVTERKSRLGGAALINLDKYPRIVFGVKVSLSRCLDFTQPFRSKILEALRQRSLDRKHLTASQAVGAFLRARGIQAIRFPSVARGVAGENLVLYVGNYPATALQIVNAAEFQTTLKNIARRKP